MAWLRGLVAVLALSTPLNALPRDRHSISDRRAATDPAVWDPNDVLVRDVAIIGGGSTGTYTAIRLQDYNHSVVVIEPKNHLGGHAETYVDPINGYTVDIGVIVFASIKVVTDYFARFNVPLVKLAQSPSATPELVDFATGEKVDYALPGSGSFVSALTAYQKQLQKYPALDTSFNLTYPVAPDLLLSFRDFVHKYNLSNMVQTTFLTNQGYAPILNIKMLYMFKYLNAEEVTSLMQGFLTTEHHDIQELYQKAAAELGADALLNSTVLDVDRSTNSSQVRVVVRTPTGRKLILAKKLVSTSPPVLANLQKYDLSETETRLFSQFLANGYYTGILNNTGLPPNTNLQNVDPSRPYGVPKLPGAYSFQYNPGINMTQVYYASPSVVSSQAVQSDILATLARYKVANNISFSSSSSSPTTTTESPSFVTFSSHAPFNLHVPDVAIQKGFYRDLQALQGQRNTFYHGAAFAAQDSSIIWKMTEEEVLPRILAALDPITS